jgi:hypothetical protein
MPRSTQASQVSRPNTSTRSELGWRRVFGGELSAIGETLKLDGKPVTIVGIAARGFYGLQFDGGADLFIPLAAMRTLGGDPRRPVRALARDHQIAVRLALGASSARLFQQMIVRESLMVAVPGVLIGIPCALAAARFVRAQLYGLERIGPMDALRHE